MIKEGDIAETGSTCPKSASSSGFDAYQKVIDAGVDLVILATPPGFRPIHFEAAVEAGKHVFMEKPVAVDAPGVRAVLAAAESARRRTWPSASACSAITRTSYIETIKRLQDGAIGDIVIAARLLERRRRVGPPATEAGQTEMEYQMRNWYYFNWLCGDHIVEQHIHNLDVINWLKEGYPDPRQGMGGRQVRTGKDYGEIFDHHAVEFEYADGSRMFSQCRHIPNCWDSVSEHVHGTQGNGRHQRRPHHASRAGTIGAYRGEKNEPVPGRARRSVRQHSRTARRSTKPKTAPASSMTAILGRMATYSGKMIAMERRPASEISLQPKEYNFKTDPPVMPLADGNYPIAVPGLTRVV